MKRKETLNVIDMKLHDFAHLHGLDYNSGLKEFPDGSWYWTVKFRNPHSNYVWGYRFTDVFYDHCRPELSISNMILRDVPRRLLE